MSPNDPVEMLRREYLNRHDRNPNYTLRAFARTLGLSSGRVSQLFARKRNLTEALATQIAERLAWPPSESERFFLALRTMRLLKRSASESASRALERQRSARVAVPEDVFDTVADWEHFAILSLMKTEGFRPEPRWIARRLGLSVVKARAALERLERVRLVTRRDDTLVRSHESLVTSDNVPSAALRRSHAQSMTQAIASLESCPFELRDITSLTLACSPEDLPRARAAIRSFHETFSRAVHTDAPRAVYALNVQFFRQRN